MENDMQSIQSSGSFRVEVRSAGHEFGNSASISLDGTLVEMNGGYRRGLNVAVIDETTGAVIRTTNYDTNAPLAAKAFAAMVEDLPVGRVIAIAAMDEANDNLTEAARRACELAGSALIHNLSHGGSWAIVGQRGAAPGAVDEELSNQSAVYANTSIPIQPLLANGTEIVAYSAGYTVGNTFRISVSGRDVVFHNNGSKGLNVAVIDEEDGMVLETHTYDTNWWPSGSDAFTSLIAGLPFGRVVAIAVLDEASRSLTADAKLACKSIGSALIDGLGDRHSWSIVGFKGAIPGSVAESLSSNSPVQSACWLMPEPPDSMQGFSLSLRSASSRAVTRASVAIDGLPVGTQSRGVNIVTIDESSGVVVDAHTYDTSTEGAADAFAALVEQLPIGRIVAVVAMGEVSTGLSERARHAGRMLGSAQIQNLGPRSSWVLIGRKGAAPGSVPEALLDTGEVGLGAWFTLDGSRNLRPFAEIHTLSDSGVGPGNTGIRIDGQELYFPGGYLPGLNVAVINEQDGTVIDTKRFDTGNSVDESEAFGVLIESLPTGRVVAIAAANEASHNLNERARRACESIGSGQIHALGNQTSWTIVGRKGATSRMITEALSAAPARCAYWLFPRALFAGGGFNVSVKSAGYAVGNVAEIAVLDTVVPIEGGTGRGLNVVIIDEGSGVVLSSHCYDTYSNIAGADAFAELIERLPPGRMVAIAVANEASANLTERAKRACESLGSGSVRTLGFEGSWALVGHKGTAPGSALEQLNNLGPVSVSIWSPTRATNHFRLRALIAPLVLYSIYAVVLFGLPLIQIYVGLTQMPDATRYQPPQLPAPPSRKKRKALFVGITYEKIPRLRLNNTVKTMTTNHRRQLCNGGFFGLKDTKLLADWESVLPTKANVVATLEWLCRDAQPGDLLYFAYLGHGVVDTTTPTPKHALELYRDASKETVELFYDTELADMLRPLPTKVNFTMVLHNCYAGGMVDDIPYSPDRGITIAAVDHKTPAYLHKGLTWCVNEEIRVFRHARDSDPSALPPSYQMLFTHIKSCVQREVSQTPVLVNLSGQNLDTLRFLDEFV